MFDIMVLTALKHMPNPTNKRITDFESKGGLKPHGFNRPMQLLANVRMGQSLLWWSIILFVKLLHMTSNNPGL